MKNIYIHKNKTISEKMEDKQMNKVITLQLTSINLTFVSKKEKKL